VNKKRGGPQGEGTEILKKGTIFGTRQVFHDSSGLPGLQHCGAGKLRKMRGEPRFYFKNGPRCLTALTAV
jgi:hypothetical protein